MYRARYLTQLAAATRPKTPLRADVRTSTIQKWALLRRLLGYYRDTRSAMTLPSGLRLRDELLLSEATYARRSAFTACGIPAHRGSLSQESI